MKYAFVALSALVAFVMADQPKFLNSQFQVTQGESFTLKFSGCETGCTIVLQTGTSNNLKDVKTLTSSATGGSFTFTPSDLASATYNFKSTDNASRESNYSQQFAYQGTGSTSASTAPASTTASATTSVTSTNTASSTAATTTSAKSSMTTVTSTSTGTSSSSGSSTTGSATTGSATTTTNSPSSSPTSTQAPTTPTTKVPGSGAGRLSSPMALVAGAVAAMAYLS
ncbi:hypothetical protein TOPH_00112 [Tolypocladium ophioglossoides CBS 100239]|uniref:Extracellular matrix protein n=1 Tax=Tolypocladium ophioglossoides (strain CBS 100239) TaxID=1163406 RepID=A0A0L0NLZ2_TOLOC|nr:hypothetical protein TOPH_00112 [Tolypocladium ophioglossoides CBS 100239]